MTGRRDENLRIYVASFFDTRSRLLPFVAQLEMMGHEVTSTWLKEAPGATYANVGEGYRLACALTDIEDIGRSSLMLLDTMDETPRGGREVEFGVALANGTPVYLIGPMRNVFHRMAHRQFSSWSECIEWLRQVRR